MGFHFGLGFHFGAGLVLRSWEGGLGWSVGSWGLGSFVWAGLGLGWGFGSFGVSCLSVGWAWGEALGVRAGVGPFGFGG